MILRKCINSKILLTTDSNLLIIPQILKNINFCLKKYFIFVYNLIWINATRFKALYKNHKTMKENILVKYFINAFEEFHKITWPTKDIAIKLTLIVLTVSIATMIFTGVSDYIFQKIFEYLIISF
ncbi:preprotein translocase subunit SecE [Candidatus Peregrinibacteria bacterium RIFOXYB2_FULL_32_7]|nr:MAG: preprotein translocase subunit SecE [Candidatus Peregrinibacteria bacterium RIFOXYB2_FULL_32_7]